MENLYFNWLAQKAINNEEKRAQYINLLMALYSCPFNYIIPKDRNRYLDGVNLRYRFGDECNIRCDYVASELDVRDCSVLEMMVALAIRCEESIMHDDKYGDRTSLWFSTMINSLLLTSMTNENFDIDYVYYRLDIFMSRQYKPDGEGGLFTIANPREDMRTAEIWYQMCWYLDTIS